MSIPNNSFLFFVVIYFLGAGFLVPKSAERCQNWPVLLPVKETVNYILDQIYVHKAYTTNMLL